MPFHRLSSCVAAVVAATFLAMPAAAAGLSVSGAWFRALPAHLPAGGYFELHNGTTATVSLIGAESPACAAIMLHKSVDTGGMTRMEKAPRIDVPAGGTVRFQPGGYHLMCMHPTAAMVRGATVPVTLQFTNHQTLTASFEVRGATGR